MAEWPYGGHGWDDRECARIPEPIDPARHDEWEPPRKAVTPAREFNIHPWMPRLEPFAGAVWPHRLELLPYPETYETVLIGPVSGLRKVWVPVDAKSRNHALEIAGEWMLYWERITGETLVAYLETINPAASRVALCTPEMWASLTLHGDPNILVIEHG